jgi:hypothetical protein
MHQDIKSKLPTRVSQTPNPTTPNSLSGTRAINCCYVFCANTYRIPRNRVTETNPINLLDEQPWGTDIPGSTRRRKTLAWATDQLPRNVVLCGPGKDYKWNGPTQEGNGLMPRSSVRSRTISRNRPFSPRPAPSNVGIDWDGVGGFPYDKLS